MPNTQPLVPFSTDNVLALILGGGQGARLFPLTKDRAKPAVPLGGSYRLVDIPISNCINSELRRIYLLTQFNSASLHQHLYQAYKLDHFSRGFVEILAAEQTLTDTSWYQGTADAVRKNRIHILAHPFEYLLVLSGDQLYRMDYRRLLADHVQRRADVTVATIPVIRDQVPGFGIMEVDAEFRIRRFVEKPKEPAVQDSLRLPRDWYARLGIADDRELFLASMGIYVFNRKVVLELLDNTATDFGKHVIPAAINTHRVYAHVFQGYWEDIGTIRAFFEANLELTAPLPRFNLYDMTAPIFTHPRFLPGSKVLGGVMDQAVVAAGCIVNQATVRESLLGVRSRLEAGSQLRRTIMMGSDYFESEESVHESAAVGRPRIGVGRNTRVENAILDKNARIGDNCVISPEGKPAHVDAPLYYIRDGIVIIPKNGVVPHGTVI